MSHREGQRIPPSRPSNLSADAETKLSGMERGAWPKRLSKWNAQKSGVRSQAILTMKWTPGSAPKWPLILGCLLYTSDAADE